MVSSIFDQEVNAELAATFIFMLISGFYLVAERGFRNLLDTLFLWMFPASVMIFLTLVIVKVIERINEKRSLRQHYVDLRRRA